MRKLLKTYLPNPDAIRRNRWLAPFGNTLLHPRLWHLNRHSAAGAVAVGLFCGLIPGPFQMLGAAIFCVVLRVNLPLALFTTLYTNPFTIVPLYLAAFGIGEWLTGSGSVFTPPPELGPLPISSWAGALIDWMAGLGKPLALGLIAMAGTLATAGYMIVRGLYRWHLIRAWRKRAARRRQA